MERWLANTPLELEQIASLCYLLTSCSSEFVEFLNRLFTPPLAIFGPFSESIEKSKSAKDLEKKGEKMKNLARQALEARRAKTRQRGEPEEESPDEDDGGDDDDSDDSEGMASRLDRILEGPPQTSVDVPRMGVPKGAPSGSREGQQRESSPRRSRIDTPPEPTPGRTVHRPPPPPASKVGHPVKSLVTGPLTRGRATTSSKGKRIAGVSVQALARRETPSRD